MQVITICDHLGLFLRSQLKHEIQRETSLVPFDSLIQYTGFDTIELRQVYVHQNALAANEQHLLLDDIHWNDIVCRHCYIEEMSAEDLG